MVNFSGAKISSRGNDSAGDVVMINSVHLIEPRDP